MKPRSVVMAGGGTGGHLFPGLALVEELRRRDSSREFHFVGTRRGLEARLLPKRGERLSLIPVRPLRGRTLLQTGAGILVLPRAVFVAAKLLHRQKPDLVVGLGGYAAGPVLLAAKMLGYPTALLEQNAVLGLTNRMLISYVGRAYLSFPVEGFAALKTTRESVSDGAQRLDSIRVLGNPVRRAFAEDAWIQEQGQVGARPDTILVLGGSQGARILNRHVPQAIYQAGVGREDAGSGLVSSASPGAGQGNEAESREKGFCVVHQTGEAMRAEVEESYHRLGIHAKVVPFIEDMAGAYRQAALVVARAGATTVAEICAMGKPSVLVPFAAAAGGHQLKNAKMLAGGGACVCIREDELPGAKLSATLAALLAKPELLDPMGAAARRLGHPKAASAIADDMEAWLGSPSLEKSP